MLTFKERWNLSQPPKPLWTIRAMLAAAILFVLLVGLDYSRNWSAVEKFYLASYVRTWMAVWPEDASQYPLLEVTTGKGKVRLALFDEVHVDKSAEGEPIYRLTEAGRQRGLTDVAVRTDGKFLSRSWHRFLSHWVYHDLTAWDYLRSSVYRTLAALGLMLLVAGPLDRERRRAYNRGDHWRKIEAFEQRRFAAEQAARAADIGSRKPERTDHPGEKPRITEVQGELTDAMPSEVVLVSKASSETELESRQETISPIMALEEEKPFFE
jgi:hypothetical protein